MNNATEIIKSLRKDGWAVAIHNDYRLDGADCTFYLFTNAIGLWAKGEGRTDMDALKEAREQASRRQAGLLTPEQISNIRDTLERVESTLGPEAIYPWTPDVRTLLDAYRRLTSP